MRNRGRWHGQVFCSSIGDLVECQAHMMQYFLYYWHLRRYVLLQTFAIQLPHKQNNKSIWCRTYDNHIIVYDSMALTVVNCIIQRCSVEIILANPPSKNVNAQSKTSYCCRICCTPKTCNVMSVQNIALYAVSTITFVCGLRKPNRINQVNAELAFANFMLGWGVDVAYSCGACAMEHLQMNDLFAERSVETCASSTLHNIRKRNKEGRYLFGHTGRVRRKWPQLYFQCGSCVQCVWEHQNLQTVHAMPQHILFITDGNWMIAVTDIVVCSCTNQNIAYCSRKILATQMCKTVMIFKYIIQTVWLGWCAGAKNCTHLCLLCFINRSLPFLFVAELLKLLNENLQHCVKIIENAHRCQCKINCKPGQELSWKSVVSSNSASTSIEMRWSNLDA